MTNRIDQTFQALRRSRRKALIAYVTAGFPTKAGLRTLVSLLERAGVDLLELGVPFSDPIADGPTIQHSSQVALANGVTLAWVLESVKALRQQGIRLPLVLMSYCNPIYAMGVDRFFQKAKSASVDGLIVPDLIPEEAGKFEKASKHAGVHLIYLAAPTTPKARIQAIARKTRGFLYAVSLTGVTGARKALPAELPRFLKSVKAVCRKPIAVGFGVSTPQQAQAATRHADGVIIGSALIKEVGRSKRSGFKEASRFITALRKALDRRPIRRHDGSPADIRGE